MKKTLAILSAAAVAAVAMSTLFAGCNRGEEESTTEPAYVINPIGTDAEGNFIDRHGHPVVTDDSGRYFDSNGEPISTNADGLPINAFGDPVTLTSFGVVEELIGEWNWVTGGQLWYVFNRDGTGTVRDTEILWGVRGNTLYICRNHGDCVNAVSCKSPNRMTFTLGIGGNSFTAVEGSNPPRTYTRVRTPESTQTTTQEAD
jgi:hypothetical protein